VRKVITDAIVLRAVDYGEADRVATLLTRAAGKVSALARGARKSRRRFVGLELFGAGEAALTEGRGDLWRLDGFDARRGYPHLALDVARVAHAAYACEVTRELSPEHGADERVYQLLAEMLALLDGGDGSASLLRAFELSLLDAVGLAPSLDRCPGCGGEAAGEATWLDARRGGLVCAACHGGGAGAVAPSVRALLIALQRARIADPPIEATPEGAAAARDALQAILREHLGKPLRSVEFIAKINAR
jgi:DNA repair protein RecO (recombination protein O)